MKSFRQEMDEYERMMLRKHEDALRTEDGFKAVHHIMALEMERIRLSHGLPPIIAFRADGTMTRIYPAIARTASGAAEGGGDGLLD